MSVENASPSVNPANNDTLAGMLQLVMRKMLMSIDGILPAQVVNYRAGNPPIVQVQPLIETVSTVGERKPRSQIAEVPVWQYGGGGFLLTFPLQPGDLGLLVACDRDISLFVQSGINSPPNTNRIKNFSDGFFLPVVMRGVTISEEDAANAVLQNLDGSVRISMFSDHIKMTGNVIIDGTLTVNKDVTLNVDSGRTINYGNLNTGADITAAGTITPGIPIPP